MSLSTPDYDGLKSITNASNADKTIANSDAEAGRRTPGDFSKSVTEDRLNATETVPTKLKVTCEQTDIQGKLDNTTKPLSNPGIEKESILETQSSEIPNECEGKPTNLESLPTDNARENITAKFEDRVTEKDLPKQAVVEETTQLPKLNSVGDIAMDTEQNSLENQDTVGQFARDTDPRIISGNGEEQFRHENPIPVIQTYQSSDANKNESDEKAENSVAVEKRDSSLLNLTISKEPQLIQDNAKTAKVPGTLVPDNQPIITKDRSSNVKLILASDPENLEKDCHNVTNTKTTKDQSAILDNSKINIFTPTPSTPILVNNATPYLNKENTNVKLYESRNGVNLKTTQETSYVHMSQSFNTPAVQTKPPLLPKISTENSRLYQSSRLSQSVYSSTRPILPNIQRPTDNSTSLQRAPGTYIDNPTLLQNKYVTEINQTNQINLYNANPNNTDANTRPLNLTDTRSKPTANNYKTTNPNRFEIPNMFQQHYQPTIQSVTSSNLPVNSKEILEYDLRFSFPTTLGINNGFPHNQRSYFKGYDGQSMQYAVNPENSNLRRNSISDRAYTVGNGANNNQTAGNFSVQQFQQYANQFGSQYLFMFPNPIDQIAGTDKLRMPHPSTNQGIVPSYQQPCKNIFPNPVNNNVYLNPNDAKLCKSQFADGRMGFYLEPNQGNIANNPISHERIHQQQMLLQQPIQRTYNTNEKVAPTSHDEIFRNRDNNNNNNNITFPVGQNSLQWGQSPQHAHHQNSAGQNGTDLKTKLPHESQSSARSSTRSQPHNSHFQRSSFDQRYPEPHLPLTNADSFSTSDHVTPSPKIQNSTRSQFKTGHPQYSMGSQSNLSNLVMSNFQGPKMTTTATIPATSTTLEAQKQTNTSIRDSPQLVSGQHPEPQRYRNVMELSTGRSGQSMPTYYTQPNMKTNGKLGQFPPPDPNTIRQNYVNSSTADKGQRANNPESILTWSQYYPPCFDPTRPLQSREYMNYDSQQREQHLASFNTQQNNINSPFYVSQSYNYKQNLPTSDSYQETPKSSNTSNSVSKSSNFVTTYNYMQHNPPTSSFDRRSNVEPAHNYSHQNPATSDSFSTDSNALTAYNNSNMSCQTFENVRTETQHKVAGEKLQVSQEISHNMAADKETLKAEIPQRSEEFPTQTETSKPKSAISEQFQKSICASGLYQKSVEIESIKSEHTLPPLSVSGCLRKPDDFLSKALTNENSGMTSEESFLFSDFDPLFTSSLLTNELEYFPETNAAFDQCFEDAASVTMAMVALNESRTQETVDPSQIHALQQQQLTPLLNITSNNNNGGSSLTDGPSSRIQFNQVQPPQITLETKQMTNQYDSGVDPNKHLAPLANKSNESIGYIPGVDLLTLSSKTSRSVIDKSASAYHNDSAKSGFPDVYNINSASRVAIPIVYNTSGTEFVNTKDTNAKMCNSGTGIKRRNRQKSVELKGPPRRRGRPPKNPPAQFTNCLPAQSVKQERTTIRKPAISGTDTVGTIIPRKGTNSSGQVTTNPLVISVTPKPSMTNPSPTIPVCASLSSESEIPGYRVGTDTVGPCRTDQIDSQKSGSLLSENAGRNSLVSTKSNRKLSEQEVIDAVTKCLETISRNEEQNDDQILEGQLDTNSESVSPLDGTFVVGMNSSTESEAISPEDQTLSKEETLMKAYIELKKKLEERMSRTLWRQSYLKRHEPKNPKYSRKLSKKECMTAYSGTTSLGPDDNVFTRYPNRPANNDGGNLVNEVDSTSISTDINSGTKKGLSNKKNLRKIESEPVNDSAPAPDDQIAVSNDQQISSPEVSDPKTSIASRLPSMAEVVRTRLSNETPPLNTNHPRPLASEVSEEPPVPNLNIPTEFAETVEKPNQLEQMRYDEGGGVNNIQPEQSGLSPRHLSLQPYSSSPLLPPPPPPPMPLKVVHCMSKREKKVGPTIVENAKNCFEAISNYLTKADSDFDSFLITYANIVQGLLNCKADRYSRIKSILLNRPKPESDAGITIGEEKNLKRPVVSSRDIDASDIKGDADRREDEIDVEDFNSSYADVVKVILSSRVDEYRNIKQALSKHISGFTEPCQWPISNPAKKVNESGVDFDVPVLTPTGFGGKHSVAPYQVENAADSDYPDTPSSVISEGNNVIPAKDKQNSKKSQGKMLDNLATKKRRKRKIQECPEDIVIDGIIAMKANIKKAPRRKGKKQSETGSALKDRKKIPFDENENSSGFRIILSSNSFIEQNVSYSDSNFKLKPDVNVEKDENPESRRSVSSDDGFVEESTGDYIMNMDSESGAETKIPGISENESSNGKDQPKLAALRNSNILRNAQPETLKKKTAKNAPSLESNMDKPLNEKDGSSNETLQLSVDELVTMNTKNKKAVRRQRSSRRSAGVNAIKCPCGCCDNEKSLKRDSLGDDIRVNTSFRKRNRAKIIKPKRANPLKRPGRTQKTETQPQKIISQLVNDNDAAPILSDDQEPSDFNMPEDIKRFALRNRSSQITASEEDQNNFKIRRELNSKLVSDLDSNDSSDGGVFTNRASDDSDDEQNLKKPAKNGTKKSTQKNRLDFRYEFLHNKKTSFIGKNTTRISATENKTKIDEENETSSNDSSLNSNPGFPSLESSKDVNTTSFKEFRREESVSKARISFKEFVPNITSTPLANSPKENLGSKYPNSCDAIENYKASTRILSGNVSNIKVESTKSFPSLDREGGDRIGLTAQDGRLNLTDNDAACDFKTEVNVKSPSNSNDANFWPEDGEGINQTSDKQNETGSCEDRLRSLIETITEINTTTKQIDEDRSNSESGYVRGDELEHLEGSHFGLQRRDEMRVKTVIVDRIDETIDCQIGINKDADSSITSSDSCSDGLSDSSSSEEEDPRISMDESHNRSDSMEVKIPSPLNPRKRNQKLKVTSVGYENKIIIRKTWQEKTKKFHNLKRKSKNIFDILSSNETEEDTRGFSLGDLKKGTRKKKLYSDKKSLSIALGVKGPERIQRSKSKIPRTKNGSLKNQDQNIDFDPEELRLSLPQNGYNKSLILSEKIKYTRGNNLKNIKDGKKKKKKMTKSFPTDLKTLPDSEGLYGNGSEQKDISESSKGDTKLAIRDSFKKQVLDSKIKPKKNSKISNRGSGEASFSQQKIRVSSDSPKGKKRSTSFAARNNSLVSTEMESIERLAVNEIFRGRTGEITDKPYSDPNSRMPLKRESSFNIEDGKDQSKLKRSLIESPDLQCSFCPRSFKRPYELLYHTRTHTGERPFPCDQCKKSFASNAALRRHRRTHSSERRHICETCGRGFVQHYAMLVHQLIHSGLKPHKCSDCPSAFRTKGSLSSHRRRRHPEEVEKESLNV